MPFMDDFMKGGWKTGLFEIDPMLCLTTYCCSACVIAEVHITGGENNFCGVALPKIGACLAAYCGLGVCQIYDYGQKLAKTGGFTESPAVAVAKLCCCGLCYLMQEYKEAVGDKTKGCGELLSTMMGPGQIEMK
mmetsp:Transcript_33194/g.77638  ORF Transcript_33194/g.77638 Transcript_33194/m.77638 type:complete len:134 (+) Transcript_33194:119-520(+)